MGASTSVITFTCILSLLVAATNNVMIKSDKKQHIVVLSYKYATTFLVIVVSCG